MSKQQLTMISLDDHSITTNLDRAGYKSMGITVRSANSFQETERLLSDESVDIVVINLDFVDVNATAVCAHIKSSYPAIPVIMTSVQTSARARNSALEAGADLFVEQPVPREYFVEKLKSLLAQQTRGSDRVDFQGSAVVRFDSSDQVIPIADLSPSGLLLATDWSLEPGSQVALKFHVPGFRQSIQVTGEVIRQVRVDADKPDQKAGLGIRFIEFSPGCRELLAEYIAQSSVENGRMAYYL